VGLDTSNAPSVVIASAASPPNTREYALWISRYPTVTDASPLADPDNDGLSNLIESALGGDPTIHSKAILPKAEIDGANLTYRFMLRVDSLTQSSLVFQHSSNLDTWQDINLNHVSDSRVHLGPTNSQGLRQVTITLPSNGSTLFGRLKITEL
jgi:hypothetical protein